MSDFNDSITEPFIDLVTSQGGDCPDDSPPFLQQQQRGRSETTGAPLSTPADAQAPLDHYPLPHRLARQEEDDGEQESRGDRGPVLPAFHVGESPAKSGVGFACDSPSSPLFAAAYSPPMPLMTLHIPFRSDAAATAATADDKNNEFFAAATSTAASAMAQHSYLWNHPTNNNSSVSHHQRLQYQHQHLHEHQHHHNDIVDCFTYGDASSCGSVTSISPASPAASWASAATSLNNQPDPLPHNPHHQHYHHHHHHDAAGAALDLWHGLSPASPADLPSPDAEDVLVSSPGVVCCGSHSQDNHAGSLTDDVAPFESEWHCEHVSPLDELVGIPIGTSSSSCPSLSSPVDGTSSLSSSMPSSFMLPPPPPLLPSMAIGLVSPDLQHIHGPYGMHRHLPRTAADLAVEVVAQSPNTQAASDGPPYAQLIFQALMSRPDRCMSLQDIYQWFRDNTDKAKAGGKGWQNSIRHNLSMNRGFIKRERKEAQMTGSAVQLVDEISGEPKRSTEWTLQDWAVENGIQSTTRYRGSKTGGGGGGGTCRKGSDGDGRHRRSSPGSPYPGYRTRGRPYGSRIASLHGHGHDRGHGQGHGYGSQHGRSASAGSMRPPTSHYYPSPSSSSAATTAVNLADPYREQLMHEAAAMVVVQSPYGRSAVKRELDSPAPASAATVVTPASTDGYQGIVIPGYHGLLQTLEPSDGKGHGHSHHHAHGGTDEAEFPFSTQHVHVEYNPTSMTANGHDDGDNSGDYVGHGHHHVY